MSNDENYTAASYRVEARPTAGGKKHTGAIVNVDTGATVRGCTHKHDTAKAATDCIRNQAIANNWKFKIIN